MNDPHEETNAALMERVNERFDKWLKMLTSRGFTKTEANRMAASYACMNRADRRKFQGERGKNRDLPPLRTVPKGKP